MKAKIKDILKIERHKRGMTQQQVANYLHMARGSYAQYETGANTPTTDNLIRLADLYGCSLDYLAGRYSFVEMAKQSFKQGYETGEKVGDQIAENIEAKKAKRKKA